MAKQDILKDILSRRPTEDPYKAIIRLSKLNYKPGNGSDLAWQEGDHALKHSEKDWSKTSEVIIDSGLMSHDDAPGNKYIYEVIWCDGSGRFAVLADFLEPIFDKEERQFRQERGL